MDAILDFFVRKENEQKSRLQFLEQEIERINIQISEAQTSIKNIDEGIDKSYNIFSSSQVANEVQNNEMAALRDMIDSYEKRKATITEEMQNCRNELQEVQNLIDVYKTSAIKQKDLKSITSKVQLALKVLDVDRERAIRQLTLALEQLKK